MGCKVSKSAVVVPYNPEEQVSYNPEEQVSESTSQGTGMHEDAGCHIHWKGEGTGRHAILVDDKGEDLLVIYYHGGSVKEVLMNRLKYGVEHNIVERPSCPEAVIQRARSKLGEKKYDPPSDKTSKDEQFAIWCMHGMYKDAGCHIHWKEEGKSLHAILVDDKGKDLRVIYYTGTIARERLINRLHFGVKHKIVERPSCPEEVIQRARSKLGEKKYDPPSAKTGESEQFAIWCMTGMHKDAGSHILWKGKDSSLHAILVAYIGKDMLVIFYHGDTVVEKLVNRVQCFVEHQIVERPSCPEEVIQQARSKLGEKKYHPQTDKTSKDEQFAIWCMHSMYKDAGCHIHWDGKDRHLHAILVDAIGKDKFLVVYNGTDGIKETVLPRVFCGVEKIIVERPLHPEVVIQQARSRLGVRNYNSRSNNEEHFAIWCLHGMDNNYGCQISWRKTGYSHHAIWVKPVGKHELRVIQYPGYPDLRTPTRPITEENVKINQDGMVARVVRYAPNPEASIQRGRSRLGENTYNVMFNNCEHFATYCITGVSTSKQVDDAAGTIVTVLGAAATSAFGAAAAAGTAAISAPVVLAPAVIVAAANYLWQS